MNMFKKQIMTVALLLSAHLASAQPYEANSPQPSGKYRWGIERHFDALRRKASRSSDGLVPVVWTKLLCSDAELVSKRLTEWDVPHTLASDSLITAQIPAARIDSICALPEVKSVGGPVTARLYMDRSLAATQTNRVHQGVGFETPFTGKGVLLCVIDVGYELNHPAFSDAEGNLRIKYFWDRNKAGTKPLTDEAKIRAVGYDNSSEGHATHVAGIAAGTPAPGNGNFSGQAPEADLMLFSSRLTDAEILEDVRRAKEYAAKRGMPCVVNMSFGASLGMHSGLDVVSKTLDGYAGEGMILVQASGNSNQIVNHVYGKMGGETAPLRLGLYPDSKTNELNMLLVFRDTKQPVTKYTLFDYNPQTRKHTDVTQNFLQQGQVYFYPDEGSGNWCLNFVHHNRKQLVADGHYLLLCISQENDEALECDVWSDVVQDGHFLTNEEIAGFDYVAGDSDYQINPFGRRTIQVGSYHTRNSWTALDGKTYHLNQNEGDISSFSSGGPVLGEWYAAPLITAPGSTICSSYSKVQMQDTNLSYAWISKAQHHGEDFYYGLMMGTSMACPQVSGIIACWLQADPTLTPERIAEIIKTTAINDEFTGEARQNWDRRWGYGKINAYEGLKQVLGQSTQIREVWDSEQPVSIKRHADHWKLLFNSPESNAEILLTSATGTSLQCRQLKNVQPGQEEVVRLTGMPRGVYVLTVKTANAKLSRSFVY